MKPRFLFPAVVTAMVAALIVLCTGTSVPPAQAQLRTLFNDPQTFFPIQAGNYWIYQRRTPTATDVWTVRVGDRFAPPNGQIYVWLDGYLQGNHPVRTLRPLVTEYNRDGINDNIWYRLGAPIGTFWTFAIEQTGLVPLEWVDCLNGSRLTIGSRKETITGPAGSFQGVVRVDWQSRCTDGGITAEYFAPGVGLVRRVEQSLAGPIVSDLVRAEVGGVELPPKPYTTEITLGRPRYVSDPLPPIGEDSIATVDGILMVRNRAYLPVTFEFAGCVSATVVVTSATGEPIQNFRVIGAGTCCECSGIGWVRTLMNDILALPFTIRLETDEGMPLPDGRYGVTATFETTGVSTLRPSATTQIVVGSAY